MAVKKLDKENAPLITEDYVRGNDKLAKAKDAVLANTPAGFNPRSTILQVERTAMYEQLKDFWWVNASGKIRRLHKAGTWVSAEDVRFMEALVNDKEKGKDIQDLNAYMELQKEAAGEPVEVKPPELDDVKLTDVQKK